MELKRSKLLIFLVVGVFIFGADFSIGKQNIFLNSVQAASNLSGRFLIQVEDLGQVWYVNPLNNKRYLLASNDALKTLQGLGLGISNKDFKIFQKKAPRRLLGRILLKVQDKGQAYYLSPVDGKLYSLITMNDFLVLVKRQGLGISNKNLNRLVSAFKEASKNLVSPTDLAPDQGANNSTTLVKIPVKLLGGSSEAAKHFVFKYKNADYDIEQNLSSSLYDSYKNSAKVYTSTSDSVPVNLREAFYGVFFKTKANDSSLGDLVSGLRVVAKNNDWSDDELLEFTLALVQYLPYDQAKIDSSSNRNNNPYYPFETLYLGRGVCSDKTFLGVALLRKLGYGAAILDFPDINHSALGIACPTEYSLNGSGYCYAEMTNYFPLGVIPQSINGQAQALTNQLSSAFSNTNLGRIEIYQPTKGKIYQGIVAIRNKVASLHDSQIALIAQQKALDALTANARQQETVLSELKVKMTAYINSGQTAQYNDLVPSYNNQVATYNSVLADYKLKIDQYNQVAADFNRAINDFYQK